MSAGSSQLDQAWELRFADPPRSAAMATEVLERAEKTGTRRQRLGR